ncbi:MAG TPA: hypothetical protein VMU65_06065 [Candidatus Saccharimonadales bacterium]|nr:hypothetical protein [Candidatus Saccharimonadales bacterium]
MTHPLTLPRGTPIEEVCAVAVADGATNSMNPRAIAVALIVVEPPEGDWE